MDLKGIYEQHGSAIRITIAILEITIILLWLLDPLGWYMTAVHKYDLLKHGARGNHSKVEQLLQWGVDPDVRVHPDFTSMGSSPITPLLFASKHYRGRFAKLLVEYGANIHATDHRGRTPLHYAAKKHHMKLIDFLLEKGANPNIRDREGLTPLNIAVRESFKAVIQRLIRGGANVNAYHHDVPENPLIYAAMKGDTSMVSFLLNLGADPNHPSPYETKFTPFTKAVEWSNPAVVCQMLSYGADPTVRAQSTYPAQHEPSVSLLKMAQRILENYSSRRKRFESFKKSNTFLEYPEWTMPPIEHFQDITDILAKVVPLYHQTEDSKGPPLKVVRDRIRSLCPEGSIVVVK